MTVRPRFLLHLHRAGPAVWLAAWVVIIMTGQLFAAPIAKVYRWDAAVEDATAFALAPTRGETMVLQPRVMSYGAPMDLSSAWTVYMLYKAVGSTNVYSVSGTVLNATNGQAEIVWTASNELAAATYAYDILVSGPTTTVVAARGAIKYRDGVATGAQLATNAPIYVLDFAQVQLLNVGVAPFLSSYELQDVRDFIASVQAGTGDLDAHDVIVRGTLNYTNWPGYLARTNDIPMPSTVTAGANISVAISTNAGRIVYTVTGAAGGGGGGGIGSFTNVVVEGVSHTNMVQFGSGSNTVWRQDTNGTWRIDVGVLRNIIGSNSVQIVVDGQLLWDINTNRTMVYHPFQMYTDDFCGNLMMFDGSRYSPSLTLYGHPNTIGLYGRGYAGSWCFAWSHATTEVGLMHAGGVRLVSSNAVFEGKLVGDLSAATNYPEPKFSGWVTNAALAGLSVTNSGTIEVRDAGGTIRFLVNGSTGATTIRGQDSDARYVQVNTNWPSFIMTNVINGVTTRYWYAYGIVTNKTP